jgi:Ner family transcriptional regulator
MRDRNRVSNSPADWHPADIKAELEKKGLSLSGLSVANKLAPTTLKEVLRRPWPRGEAIVAKAIGLEPAEIWPSRYAHRARRARMQVRS